MTIERIDETMAKIDIISGFLGAGKTTLIKKLIAEAFEGEKLVTNQRTANATGIHLCNLDSCLFQKSTIDTDLTELVLDQD